MVNYETVDKMTDRQIAGKVRKCFQKWQAGAVIPIAAVLKEATIQPFLTLANNEIQLN